MCSEIRRRKDSKYCWRLLDCLLLRQLLWSAKESNTHYQCPVKVITHAFLTKVHSQNERDNVVNLTIEKSLKSGSILHAHQYVFPAMFCQKVRDPYKLFELSQ